MLSLERICFDVPNSGEDRRLLDNVTFRVPSGHFMAIVGPSGCGKSTLLKTIAGINAESEGNLYFDGRNLAEDNDFEATEIGYVPQFSIAFDELTVDEAVEAAARLRLQHASRKKLDELLDRILAETGLLNIADSSVKILSGGQKRRLGLAMELVSSPKLLLCDEVTSGLDPNSEREIVHLLNDLARKEDRIVVSVTHSLSHMELYDSVLVIHEGRVVYHGPPSGLAHYFSVDSADKVYPALAKQASERWQSSWLKYANTYEHKLRAKSKTKTPEIKHTEKIERDPLEEEIEEEEETQGPRLPGILSQTLTLLSRRFRIFCRDRGQLILHLALIIGFPILVSIFAPRANEQTQRLSDQREENIIEELGKQAQVQASELKVGSANSGIIMFQVILLCLVASNNSAREISSERAILEKEKFGGLSPPAYLLSKILFLTPLVLMQSLWMGIFVQTFWEIQGSFLTHLTFLVLVNAAMTSICLGISSLARNAEQASALSIYFVGFQLPLSGAVLALPSIVEPFTRPFISAYWAWSGSISALDSGRFNAVKAVVETAFAEASTSQYFLLAHIVMGLTAALIGIQRPRWGNL